MVCGSLRRFDGTFRASGVTMTDSASQCHLLHQLLVLLALAAVSVVGCCCAAAAAAI